MKSSIAAPCFRNSGLLTTLNGCVVSRRTISRTLDGGPDRDGALVDDDLVAVHRLAMSRATAEHVLQIGRAVLAGRRADRDEDDLRVSGRRPIERGGERQPFFRAVAPDHLLEAGLVDRESCRAAAAGSWPDPCRRRRRRCRSPPGMRRPRGRRSRFQQPRFSSCDVPAPIQTLKTSTAAKPLSIY